MENKRSLGCAYQALESEDGYSIHAQPPILSVLKVPLLEYTIL
jgi:hypothetical protein